MKPLSEIVAVKQENEAELLGRKGVTAVDVGYKYVDGRKTDEIAIRVMVAKKKKKVSEEEMVPEEIDGVRTDVIERTYELLQFTNRLKIEDATLAADTGTYDPIRGGISIGPCRSIGGYVYVGTLGAVVRDNATNNPLLLSNFHVMCVDNNWHVGDDMAQPSRVDTGSCPGDRVGSIVRASLTGAVDAAVCSLEGRSWNCDIVDIGNIEGTAAAVLNAPVRKRGRTTGLTYGTIESVSLTVPIDYGDGIGTQTLTNQISIETDTGQSAAFCQKGDSGSVVVDANRRVIGLLFAQSSDSSGKRYGIANPIAEVLSALNISMCTSIATLKEVPKDPIKDGRYDTIKEVRKDPIKDGRYDTIKEVRKDSIKDVYKDPITDGGYNTIKEVRKDAINDLDTAKEVSGDPVDPRLPVQPRYYRGGASPFVTGAPSRAAMALQDQDPVAEALAYVQALEEALLALEQQTAELLAAYEEAVANLDALAGGQT